MSTPSMTGSPTKQYSTESPEDSKFTIANVAGVIGVLVTIVIVSIIIACYCAYKKRMKCRRPTNRETSTSREIFSNNECSASEVNDVRNIEKLQLQMPLTNYEVPMTTRVTTTTCLLEQYKKIFNPVLISASKIKFAGILGEGAFGKVNKGFLSTERTDEVVEKEEEIEVAIKQLKENPLQEQVEEFISESAIMLDFDHPNVLKLLGVCFDTQDGLPLIVLPYMANGDLKAFLVSKRGDIDIDVLPKELNLGQIFNMCIDIAKGMEYLSKKKYVHRDLAARNCMVDSLLSVKVADFGFSRDVYCRDYYRLERRTKLPVKWLPPESLVDNIFNEKSDVWAFGVTCWEVFSLGRVPYPGVDNADILDYISTGKRLNKPPLAPEEIYSTIRKCWMKAPEHRPTFSDLVQLLHSALLTIVKHGSGHDLGGEDNASNKGHSSLGNNDDDNDDDTQF